MIHPTTQKPHNTCCTGRRAFSLVELLVVVSIISLLVGLGVGALALFRPHIQARQTGALLQNLHSIATEYQASTGRVYESSDNGCDAENYIKCFVQAAWNLPETEQMTRNLRSFLRVCEFGPDQCDYKDSQGWRPIEFDPAIGEDGDFETPEAVVDIWGRPIRYLPDNVGEDRDPDLPVHRRPFFVSAGLEGWDNSDDNIYSFDLD